MSGLQSQTETPRLCRCGCGRPPGPRRRNWHSQECVDAWRQINDWPLARSAAIEHYGTRCALCGRDPEAMWNRLRDRSHHIRYGHIGLEDESPRLLEIRRTLLEAVRVVERQLWAIFSPSGNGPFGMVQVDHIIARVDGGTNALENLRILCWPCHRERTAQQAAERARARRTATQPELFA